MPNWFKKAFGWLKRKPRKYIIYNFSTIYRCTYRQGEVLSETNKFYLVQLPVEFMGMTYLERHWISKNDSRVADVFEK